MTALKPPSLNARRTDDFLAELLARARAWIPTWSLADDERDFGRALLEVAARFSSEVAQRLDQAGDKMQRGLLDWLAMRGEAARPARVPVVFKLTDSAQAPVLATSPARMQAAAGDASVIFETEADVQIVPGQLDIVVAADADADAYYLPAPGLSDLQPIDPAPTEWHLKSFAAAGDKRLQLDPDSGLAPDMLIEAGGQQYRIVGADKDIVTIDPPLDGDLDPASTVVEKVSTFAPFDGEARNRQEHAVYLGDTNLFNLEAAATIDIVGAQAMRTGVDWQYWGTTEDRQDPDWQYLTLADDQDQKNDALVLKKGKGSIAPLALGVTNSRWLRGYTKSSSAPVQVDELAVRINCTTPPEQPPDSPPPPDQVPSAEAMTNTTPIDLNNVFFPLGKEPRQFDAFYLGSSEAFSKEGAQVDLLFDLADPTFQALAAVHQGMYAEGVLAGVAKDGALHLYAVDQTTGALTKFLDREPLQPPMPGYQSVVAQSAPSTVALDPQPSWRPPTWSEPDAFTFFGIPSTNQGFLVAVTAGDSVWIWHENPQPTKGGWIELDGVPPSTQTPPSTIAGLAFLATAGATSGGTLFALRDGVMYARDWPNGPRWKPVATTDTTNNNPNTNSVALSSIVPVQVVNAGVLGTSTAAGMVGISDLGLLYRVTTAGLCTPTPAGVVPPVLDPDIQPVAIEVNPGDPIIGAVTTSPPTLYACWPSQPVATRQVQTALAPNTTVIGGLEAKLVAGAPIHILASIDDGAAGRVGTWAPYLAGALGGEFESPITSGGPIDGSPTVIGAHVVVPGKSADILVNEFDPTRRIDVPNVPVGIGVIVPSPPVVDTGYLIVRADVNGNPESHVVTSREGPAKNGDFLCPIDSPFNPGATGPILAYQRPAPPLSGTVAAATLTLDSNDRQTNSGDWLFIKKGTASSGLYTVTGPPNAARTVPITPVPPAALAGSVTYARPIITGGRMAPFIRLDPSGSGNWDADLLPRVPLVFPGNTPEVQTGEVISLAAGNRPLVVALGAEFTAPIVNPAEFLLDLAFDAWQDELGETASSPQLSWEYSNGKGWSGLDLTLDETLNLKHSGIVRFDVPDDIAPSDWAGKTDTWIRARLVGGDYGREEVTVTVKDLGNGVTQQTVNRSTDGIRPPLVVKLYISYSVCTSVTPQYVITDDSGSRRDQSVANNTPGAIVEAFVPLAVMLGRLSAGAVAPRTPPTAAATPSGCDCWDSPASAQAPSPAARPSCGCGCNGNAAAAGSQSGTTPAAVASAPATGRALFVGLTLPPSDGPVRVLLLVAEERPFADFAPMSVAALVSDRFVPIVSDDATRAVGESGLVTMNFTVPPTPRDLFGRTCAWLRLTPKAAATLADWKPSIKGAYVNAVWASAMETLTRELVGSSDGSPALTVTLARPPLLRDTLELRVSEPLGDEERTQLLARDPQSVVSNAVNLPGDWVLWKRVVDPGDANPGERVYALDEGTGTITFGDGQHGMIPPVGTDSIVAFSYRRTEPPAPGSDEVPGNEIKARLALGLVSPIATVDSVMAADQAAGGSPPESVDRVVRFAGARLRHRERAVTARDLEDIALESSPDIAQVSCLQRRGYARLIVVMRGPEPRPNAAQVRELRRLLLAAGPTALSQPNALRVEPPVLRRLRVALDLRIDRLDNVGALDVSVKEQLAAFFDPATGGKDEDGWKLGDDPDESDIALALTDAPHLESISGVTLTEIADDGSEGPWPTALKPNELAALDSDPLRVRFEPVEEAA